jgi:hypothetical protein
MNDRRPAPAVSRLAAALRPVTGVFLFSLVFAPTTSFTPQQQVWAAPAFAASSDDDRIIVGPVTAHAFQNDVEDDPGAAIDATQANLPRILADLGPDAATWYQHVMTLSNPFFEGRQPGLRGNAIAAEYIEFYFKRYGLEPAFPAPAPANDAGAEPAALGGDDITISGPSAPAAAESDINAAWTSYRQPFTPRGRENLATENVGGVLRGKGDLADEWIIVGAHFDHTGYARERRRRNQDPGDQPNAGSPPAGGATSAGIAPGGGAVAPNATQAPPRDAAVAINTGADDNASGTAGMLVLAEKFSQQYATAAPDANLRSILFMGFSAEEMGLLGSDYYVRNSTIAADDIQIMVNLDMIGRLRNNDLMVQGVGTAEGLLDRIRPRLLESGLTIHADPSGQGPSDHASFHRGGLPVLFFFTGVHNVYHRPGDQGPTVNPLGARKVIDLAYNITSDLAAMPERLQFAEAAAEGDPGAGGGVPGGPGAAGAGEGRRPTRGSLGILPDFRSDLATGVLIDRVLDDGPALAAGLKPGDIILAWNGTALENSQALFRQTAAHKPGDEVTLTIKRGEEQFDTKVTLR